MRLKHGSIHSESSSSVLQPSRQPAQLLHLGNSGGVMLGSCSILPIVFDMIALADPNIYPIIFSMIYRG